jgi:hypothetical protein
MMDGQHNIKFALKLLFVFRYVSLYSNDLDEKANTHK